MSRPAGSKNKSKGTLNELAVVFGEKRIGEIISHSNNMLKEINKVHYDLTLSIRAFRTGQWKGLWELSKLENDGKRVIIVDATSRQSVINMVNRQIMRMVIAA